MVIDHDDYADEVNVGGDGEVEAGDHLSKTESKVRDAFVISGQSRLFRGGGAFP